MNIPHDHMSHSSAHLTHRSLMPELVSALLHFSTTPKQEQKTPVRCPGVRSLTQLPVAATHSPQKWWLRGRPGDEFAMAAGFDANG
jgi:hypothetical protein